MTKKLIPFDWDKYQAGCRAVRKDKKEILTVQKSNSELRARPIVCLYREENGNVEICTHDIYGKSCAGMLLERSDDIFLEAETIDLWIGLSSIPKKDISGLMQGYECTWAYTQKENIMDVPVIKKIKITVDAETLEQIL